ncbi:MAG TPA: hypothetical protein VGY31_04825 [Terriglobia bacterium]|nr:hypothetical protein [Terriglobia bacterium]
MNLYHVESNLILPFRSWLPPCESSGHYLDDEWESKIVLTYAQRTQVLTGVIDTTLCTIASVSTSLKLDGDKEHARKWARNNAAAIFADTILPKLNYLFLQLKWRHPQVILTGKLRSVGDIDVIFLTLFFEGEAMLARSSSSLNAAYGPPAPSFLMEGRSHPDGPAITDPNLPGPLSKEWIALTRAVDLVNHGYFAEAILVAFALLDAIVQDFVKARLPNLDPSEARRLLRKMGSQRLETLLGPLLRICVNASPLDDEQMKAEIAWLNEKRNAIIHSGKQCLRGEAQRGLRTIWQILKYLAEKGANYSLPYNLEFYTPPSADFPTS